MIEAYARLAALGYAHSVEAWAGDELAGGLYGVAIGRMFFGESMFSRGATRRRWRFVQLVRQLERWELRADRLPDVDDAPGVARRARDSARGVPPSREPPEKLEPVPAPWVLDEDLVETI